MVNLIVLPENVIVPGIRLLQMGTRVGVRVGVSVCVRVLVAVGDRVIVGESVKVGVELGVSEMMGVKVAVLVGVSVAVFVGVARGVFVAVDVSATNTGVSTVTWIEILTRIVRALCALMGLLLATERSRKPTIFGTMGR